MREPGRRDSDHERELVKRAALVAAIASAVAAVTCAAASAGDPWVPGSSYYVRASAVESHFEKAFDSANCVGIPRFGRRKHFPYGPFRMFYCDTKRKGRLCFAIKVKVVKGARREWFRTIPLNVSRVRCTGTRDVPAADRPTVAEDQSQLRAAASSVESTSARADG
jgi:hypothetical protein